MRKDRVRDLSIRQYETGDAATVIDLWDRCDLSVPWNNPYLDIRRKTGDSPELFFVAEAASGVVGTCMAGYDGHRGWLYYLAVHPGHRRQGIASRLVEHAEQALTTLGCPKVDLMVRNTNRNALGFYGAVGYSVDPVRVLSRRLTKDPPREEPHNHSVRGPGRDAV